MSFFQIISFFLITILIAPKIKCTDDGLYQTSNKEVEKRRDNFRVPVDMPFDPKFWPTRGRRADGTLDAADQKLKIGNFILDWGPKSRSNCSDLVDAIVDLMSQECMRFFDQDSVLNNTADKTTWRRQKKPRYIDIPELVWTNGRNQLWKPDLSYQEKEKKQNIFWVTRGKRSLY